MILGVPWSFAVELPEMTDVFEGNRWMTEAFVFSVDRLCAREMEHRPEQHRSVAVREHEPVAVGPDRVLRIEAHDAIPNCVNQRRQGHRCAGVPGFSLLDRIHRERADSIDRQLNHVFVCHCFSYALYVCLGGDPFNFLFTAKLTKATKNYMLEFTSCSLRR